jgi:Conjugative transposon protein TcpC
VESPAPAALRPYLAPEVVDQLAGRQVGGGAAVAQATVAGVRPLASDRAIVTVACQLAGPAGRTLNLAVPVARDPGGGLSVVGLPSFVGSPLAGQAEPDESQPLSGSETEQIGALVQRFLSAYLTNGDAGDLAYLLAPGAGVAPVGGGLRLVEVTDVNQLGTAGTPRLTALAQATVRDAASGAAYPAAYRLELVRRDRWYVAAVEGALP